MDIAARLAVFNFFLLWGFCLLPPILLRYIWVDRPLGKIAAIFVCAVLFSVSVVVAVAIGAKSINVFYLIGLASYFILVRPDENPKASASRRSLADVPSLGKSDRSTRLPISSFEMSAGASRAPNGVQGNRIPSLKSDSQQSTAVEIVERVTGIRQSLEKLSALERSLIIIGVVFLLIVAFYYLASPYQNCIKNSDTPVSDGQRIWCMRNTSW